MSHTDSDANEAALAAVEFYTPMMLRFYDLMVYGINTPFLWRCPERELLYHYNQHISGNHLDVGVGTGYLLDRCRFPTASPRLFLLDLSPNPLEVTSKRLQRYRPQTLQRNVLTPIHFDGDPFDSIGTNYMIHCVPGSIPEKSVLFDHLGALLKPGGVIFGSTLLGEGVELNRGARWLMDISNKKRVISNTRDSHTDLRRALEERFIDVSVRLVGAVGIFSARKRADAPVQPGKG
jgi:SAM-dependent methyltransferase